MLMKNVFSCREEKTDPRRLLVAALCYLLLNFSLSLLAVVWNTESVRRVPAGCLAREFTALPSAFLCRLPFFWHEENRCAEKGINFHIFQRTHTYLYRFCRPQLSGCKSRGINKRNRAFNIWTPAEANLKKCIYVCLRTRPNLNNNKQT